MTNQTENNTTHQPVPIELTSFGMTLNTAADLTPEAVNALEAKLSPEFRSQIAQMQQLAATFRALEADLPDGVSIGDVYAALDEVNGDIDKLVPAGFGKIADSLKNVPGFSSLNGTADNIGTISAMFGGALAVPTTLVGALKASWVEGGDFIKNFAGSAMDADQAKAFAVLYAATQQEEIARYDALPSGSFNPFDDKETKVESNLWRRAMAYVENWGSKLLGVPGIREVAAGVMASWDWVTQIFKEPHERKSFSKLFATNLEQLKTNAQEVLSVDELVRGGLINENRTEVAQKLTAFYGLNAPEGQLSAAIGSGASVDTTQGQVNFEDGNPEHQENVNEFAQLGNKAVEVVSTPGGAIGAGVGVWALHKYQVPQKAGNLVKGALQGTAGFARDVVNTSISGTGGAVAGVSDGLGRTAGLGNTATKLGADTAAGNAVRTVTDRTVDTISSASNKLTGATSTPTATAGRAFRWTQGAGRLAGRAAAPLAIVTSGWDVIKGAEALQEGDMQEVAKRGTSVGLVGAGAATGAAIGVWAGGIGAAPGALIGAGIGGIVDLFAGNSIANAIAPEASDTTQTTTAGELDQGLQEAARAISERVKTAEKNAALRGATLSMRNNSSAVGAGLAVEDTNFNDLQLAGNTGPTQSDVAQQLFGVQSPRTIA